MTNPRRAKTARGNEEVCLKMPWVRNGKDETFEWPQWPAGRKAWEWMQRVMVDYCRLYRECGFKACERRRTCATPNIACFAENEALLRKHVLPGLLKAIDEAYARTQGREAAPLYDPDAADVARDRRMWQVRDGETREGEGESDGGATTTTSPRRRPGSRTKVRRVARPTGSRPAPG